MSWRGHKKNFCTDTVKFKVFSRTIEGFKDSSYRKILILTLYSSSAKRTKGDFEGLIFTL